MADRPDWDHYFLDIARAVAARADCTRAQHGAVIVDARKRIVSTGYNGSPPGGKSCLKGECPRGQKTKEELAHNTPDYSDCIALHAETNAIAYAPGPLYICTLYITGEPCDMCRKLVTAAGICRIVWPNGEMRRQEGGDWA